jgi:DNA repair protein RecO (recombination protein O)
MYSTKTRGIVIKSYDYGDGHRIVNIFSENIGKVKAVAKSSRKTKSKFGSALEPLTENHFLFYKKPNNSIYTITGCNILESHSNIRENMRIFGYAAIMLEGIDLLCAEEDEDLGIYGLISDTLKKLEHGDTAKTTWLFFFKLLKYAGYRLNFFYCSSCKNNKFKEPVVFSPKDGGVLCKSCAADKEIYWNISGNTIESIKGLASDTTLDKRSEQEIKDIISKYLKYQYNKELKSLKFLELFKPICCNRNE